MVKVEFKKLHELAQIPQRATEFAGGWDVVVTDIEHKADDFIICKLGFALSFPKEYKMTFVPRSSITKTKWFISNSPCLGDSDYRHEYQLRFRALPNGCCGDNLDYPEFPFKIGERIGQCYLEEVIPMEFVVVSELSETDRKGGFGSTGKQ